MAPSPECDAGSYRVVIMKTTYRSSFGRSFLVRAEQLDACSALKDFFRLIMYLWGYPAILAGYPQFYM